MKIVHLDDSETIRMTVEHGIDFVAESNELEVDFSTFATQDEVFALSEKEAVDILILDNQLWHYNCSEHLDEFREAFPNALICMCSGDKENFIAMGADYQIEKPLGFKELENLIKQRFGGV